MVWKSVIIHLQLPEMVTILLPVLTTSAAEGGMMSAIDRYQHEFVGRLVGLPIYHPLQEIEDEGFKGNQNNLFLGGGSGEHPVMSILSLPVCVAVFLEESCVDKELDNMVEVMAGFKSRPYWPDWLEELSFQAANNYEINGWSFQTVSDFYQSCIDSDPHHLRDREFPMMVEIWIQACIGELIWFSLPQLNPLHDKMKEVVGHRHVMPIFSQIWVPPPGYQDHLGLGKIIKDGEAVFGISIWDNSK